MALRSGMDFKVLYLKAMQNDRLDINPKRSEENSQSEELSTQDVVRRHMEDENHVITDEELQNIRVGQSDEAEPVATEGLIEAREDDEIKTKGDPDKDHPVTPWDVVD